MGVGIGFHPDLTGYQNIRHSPLYSAFPAPPTTMPWADVVDFCELGNFISPFALFPGHAGQDAIRRGFGP